MKENDFFKRLDRSEIELAVSAGLLCGIVYTLLYAHLPQVVVCYHYGSGKGDAMKLCCAS